MADEKIHSRTQFHTLIKDSSDCKQQILYTRSDLQLLGQQMSQLTLAIDAQGAGMDAMLLSLSGSLTTTTTTPITVSAGTAFLSTATSNGSAGASYPLSSTGKILAGLGVYKPLCSNSTSFPVVQPTLIPPLLHSLSVGAAGR